MSGLPGTGDTPKILFSCAVSSMPSLVVSSSVTSRIWISIQTCPRTKSNFFISASTSGRYRCRVVIIRELVSGSAKTVTFPLKELISCCCCAPPEAKNLLKLNPPPSPSPSQTCCSTVSSCAASAYSSRIVVVISFCPSGVGVSMESINSVISSKLRCVAVEMIIAFNVGYASALTLPANEPCV